MQSKMDVIKQPNNNIISFLGGQQQRVKDKNYRLNKYCIEIPVESGTLLHNTLTGGLVLIKPLEMINIYTSYPCDYAEYLLGNYYIVPEFFDEDDIIQKYRDHNVTLVTDNYLDHPGHYTILTTSKCNARCFYCYENGIRQKHDMSLDTAEKIAQYIIDRNIKGKQITLDWFGGEPLFNDVIIDLITSRLASARINYRSTMISNGLLFTQETIKKAKYQWKLNSVQITLDGTEDVYNKVKNYKDPKTESPFKQIIKNIHNLLSYEIHVSIRLNADAYNVDNLLELVEYLYKEFKGNKYFSIYSHEIFEINGRKRTDEENKLLYTKLTELNKSLINKGFLFPKSAYGIKATHCKVDSGSGIVINPDGGIGLCEHFVDSRHISHIDNPNDKDFQEIKSWRNYIKCDQEICKDCKLKPTCLKAVDCPDQVLCSIYQKEYLMEYLKTDLIETMYQHYNNNQHGSCKKK